MDTGHGQGMEKREADSGNIEQRVAGQTRDTLQTRDSGQPKRDKLQRNDMGHGTWDKGQRTWDMGYGT